MFFDLLVFKQKALAARSPLLPDPRHLPFTPTPHLPGTRAVRCLSRQTMGSGPARQPARAQDPERAERGGGCSGEERSEEGRPYGEGGRLPLGAGDSLQAQGEREAAGISCASRPHGPESPAPLHRPALTSTIANRSSSSPGSGIGSFKGTLCALKSVCCESMLPALPMLAARRGPGAALGRLRPRRKSEQLPAAGTRALARPARLPALRCAPASVQRAPLPSSARSRAAPRPPSCSPPPQRRPGLSSSGGVVRAPGASVHVAPLARHPCQRSQRAGAWFFGLLPPGPGQRPLLTLPAHRRRTRRPLSAHLHQTNAAPRSRHNAPSSRDPAPGLAPPTRPADCRDA